MTNDWREDYEVKLSPYATFLGAEKISATPELAVLQIECGPQHLNPTGMVHGGVMVSLADNTATMLANTHRMATENDGKFMVGIDLHATFLSNQPGGTLRTEARFVRAGKRVAVVRTQVLGAGGRLLAEVTTTHVPA
jgi:1,4-dihydroxy-2-naphthoyl-CoA hydrolase